MYVLNRDVGEEIIRPEMSVFDDMRVTRLGLETCCLVVIPHRSEIAFTITQQEIAKYMFSVSLAILRMRLY